MKLNEMPSFLNWCEKNDLELPELTERRARTGAKEGLYPSLYFAGQYTDLWKIPGAADAHYYQSINKK